MAAAALTLGLALTLAPAAPALADSPVSLQSTQVQELTAASQGESLEKATVTVDDQTCTGEPLTPIPKVTLRGKTLIQFIDYTCSYESNVIPGTATVTVTGRGAYTGSQSATFEIEGTVSLTKATVVVGKQTYTGSALTPAPKVSISGQELLAGKDYDVKYVNNVDAGTAAVTILGKGNFTRTQTILFKIAKADVSDATIGAMASMPHTGKALTPSPAVSYGDKQLAADTDYTLSYENNVKSGTATVTVTGQGNFTGTKTAQFKIAKESLKRAKVEQIETEYVSEFEVKTPTPKVTCAGKRLQQDVDYTLSYKNNDKPGMATVTIKGKGDYAGVTVAKFKLANLGDGLARKACELSYSQQRWVKNGFKGTRAYLDAYRQYKIASVGTPISCSVGMHIVARAAGYDANFKINTAQDCSYLNFWGKTPGNSKWTCLGDYSSGMELQPGDILLGDKKKGVNHIFMYVGSEIAQEVYESSLKGTDADMGAPVGEWVSAHARYGAGGDGGALCICEWKTASAGHNHYKVFRCTNPDWK